MAYMQWLCALSAVVAVAAGCSSNGGCDGRNYNDAEECYMEYLFDKWTANAGEGFCLGGSIFSGGDCVDKRGIGESCKQNGDYDNNYCVTRHCDSGFNKCRAFGQTILGGEHWLQIYDMATNCDQYVVTLDLNPDVDLFQCEGDCDTDADCNDKFGDLVCFHRVYASDPNPPGCKGTSAVYANWDYCVLKEDAAAAYPDGWNPISNEPDADAPTIPEFEKDRRFVLQLVFPGKEYAVALLAAFALLCCVWTLMARRFRGKAQFQVVSQCEDSQEEDNCL